MQPRHRQHMRHARALEIARHILGHIRALAQKQRRSQRVLSVQQRSQTAKQRAAHAQDQAVRLCLPRRLQRQLLGAG